MWGWATGCVTVINIIKILSGIQIFKTPPDLTTGGLFLLSFIARHLMRLS